MERIKPYWMLEKDPVNFRFHIKQVNFQGYHDYSDVPETSLPFFAFTYLLDGEILAEINDKPILCQAGQLLLIPQGVPFSIKYFSGRTGYECGFSFNVLKDLSYDCLHSRTPVHQAFLLDEADFTARLLEQLEKAFRKNNEDLVACILDLILCRLEKHDDAPGNSVVNKFLDMVFNRERPLEKVSDYAGQLCITPNYLNRLVRNNTGHSAMDWIEISRMNLAKSLLKMDDLQISEVAAAVGIDDQSYFTRFFKKVEGITPSQYRSKRRQK